MSLEKTDFVGAHVVDTPAKRDFLLDKGNNRGQFLFDALQPFAGTPATPPTSLADMLDTYTLPDVDAVDTVLVRGGLQGHQFLSWLTLIGTPAGAAITTAGGDTSTPAVVTLSGLWDGENGLTIGLDTDLAPGQSAGPFVPLLGNPDDAAAALAPLYDAVFTDVSCVANGATLEFRAVSPSATVTITSAVVS